MTPGDALACSPPRHVREYSSSTALVQHACVLRVSILCWKSLAVSAIAPGVPDRMIVEVDDPAWQGKRRRGISFTLDVCNKCPT